MVITVIDPVGPHGTNAVMMVGIGVTALTPPEGADAVLLQASGQNIRFTLDGTTPTSNVGFQLGISDPIIAVGISRGVALQLVAEQPSAVIQYQWFKM